MRESNRLPILPEPSEAGRMVALSRAQPSDAVAVVGPHGIDTVVELCRQGFDRVSCSLSTEFRACTDPNVIVLIGGPTPDSQLAAMLRAVPNLVGDAACVVVHLTDIDQDRLVQGCLGAARLTVRSTVFDLSTDVLVLHHVDRHQKFATAA